MALIDMLEALCKVLAVFLMFAGIFCVLATGTMALATSYDFARKMNYYWTGQPYPEFGIPCKGCQRLAFPVEGTVNRYRCWTCQSRFDGPRHN